MKVARILAWHPPRCHGSQNVIPGDLRVAKLASQRKDFVTKWPLIKTFHLRGG